MGKAVILRYHGKWLNFYGNPAVMVKNYRSTAVAVKKVAVVAAVVVKQN